eukprot:3941002-Rhodomonas_salina.6
MPVPGIARAHRQIAPYIQSVDLNRDNVHFTNPVAANARYQDRAVPSAGVGLQRDATRSKTARGPLSAAPPIYRARCTRSGSSIAHSVPDSA